MQQLSRDHDDRQHVLIDWSLATEQRDNETGPSGQKSADTAAAELMHLTLLLLTHISPSFSIQINSVTQRPTTFM